MACKHTLKLDKEYEFNSREELDAVLEGIDVNEITANPQGYKIENGKIVENIQLTPITEVKYQKTPINDKLIASEQSIRDLASRLVDRIGGKVTFESDLTKDYSGYSKGNEFVINLAKATLDTPIHEILGHPIIATIKQNPQQAELYNNLIKELEFGYGKIVLSKVKLNYNNLSFEAQQEEAIVQLLGELTAGKIKETQENKNLISKLKQLLKEMTDYLRSLFNAKEIEISKLKADMTLNDLANLLAYTNSKIILPGNSVEYTTPDNMKFKTYQEASKHISDLANSIEDVDLNGININSSNNYFLIDHITKQVIDSFDTEANAYNKGEEIYNSTGKRTQVHINPVKEFIEKNKEYEQSKEIIEEWKKINNIQYNPEEVYSRGQEFVSVVGAYSSFDVNLMMQNLLVHIEDNEKAGGQFAISAFTKPVNKSIGHLEGGGGKIKFKIYPKSEDILWASNIDVFSGSVWDASEKINKDKKSELLGVSYTKYPSLITLDSVQPNLANIIDKLAHHHNELGIVLTGSNFRLEYDNDIPNETKKILNSINSILDQKYGKIQKPEIKKIGSGIQPTQTESTLNESINQTKIIIDSIDTKLNEFDGNINDYIGFSVEKYNDKYEVLGKRKLDEEELQDEDYKNIWEKGYIETVLGIFENEKSAYDFLNRTKKEYNNQALINTKIATLKEVAKKYPRSLIRSEVVNNFQSETQYQKSNELTPEQRQNIQELKQLEPVYAQASDETVQSFIESIYPESKVKDIVWHGTKELNEVKNKGFDKSKVRKDVESGLSFFEFTTSKTYSDTFVNRNLKEGFDGGMIAAVLNEKSNNLTESAFLGNGAKVEVYDDYFTIDNTVSKGDFKYGISKKEMQERGVYHTVFEPEQITILNSPETIQKFQEFIGKDNQYQRITTQLELSDLPANQKANAEHLLHSFINLLKKKFPNIKFNVDYFNRSEMGWLDTEGVVNINLNKVSLSTPFHELAHVVVALIKDSDPNTYEKLKEAVKSLDGLMEAVRKQYPELSEELQIEEAIVTLIGELAANKKIDENIKRSWSNVVLNRIKEWLIKSINKVLEANFNYKPSKENPFHYKFDKFIETIVDDLTDDSVNEISSRRISAIIKEVKYQKANAIETSNSLLTFISGRNVNTNDTGNKKQAKNIVGNVSYEYEKNGRLGFFTSIQAKQDFIDPKNPKGGSEEFILYSSDNKDARIEQVLEVLRTKKSTDVDETIALIQEYYTESNSKQMLDNIKNKPLLYTTIKSLFPNYKVNDEILKYEELKVKYPELYNPDLDNPLLLVRIGKDGSVDVVTISNESIQQTTTSGSIIAELGSKKSMFEKLGNKMLTIFKSITLSNDFVNVASLHVMMVAMDLKVKGRIIDTLSVSQFKDSKSDRNYNIERIDRNKYLFNLKKILSIEVVKERIKDSELGKMFYKKDEINEQVFEAEQYTKSFLDSLMDMTLVGANNSTYNLTDKVKNYKEATATNTNIVDTYNELKKAIRIALANLNSTLKTDSDKVKSKEYVLLSQTLFFLETNSQLSVNEYKEIGALEQWITSLKTTQNPFLNWWTKMWDNKRYIIIEKFLEYQKIRDVKYEKILNENRLGTDYIASNPNKFKNILEGSYFKQDDLLNPDELAFKKYYMNHLKELAYLSWLNNTQYKYNEELRAKPTSTVKAEFEKWYDASVWSKGAIPLIKSTISSAIFQGKAKESIENIFDRMINENPYYEEDNVDFSKIPDFMYNQSMVNNYEETLNRLDVHEVDLRKISDIFTMQAYKQEFMKDLIPTYKAAVILMKFTESELGLDKEIAAREGIDEFDKGTIISRDVDLLKNTFEMLLFNRKKTIGTDATAKRINKFLTFTSTLTTHAAVALSPLTDMKTFIQSFSRMLAQGLANIGDENLFDITQVPKLIYDFVTNPGETYKKAVDIGVKLRVINMDEFDLLVNRFHTKEKFSIFDSRNNFWLNRIGDNSIKLMIMSMLMKKDKSWDAWTYNEQTKQYEYDKSKDTRPKSIVETVEQNYLKENSGIKDKLDTSHDGDMRRVLEKRVADVVGGFTDGTKTKLGMTHAGSAITKFKTYWLNRAEKFIKGEVVNEQEFDYVDEDGKTKRMNKTDVGYLKTFQKTIAGISIYYNQPAKVWNELTIEDHKNIYRTLTYTFVVSLAFFAKEMLDSDDDKDKVNSIYESIIADMWVLDQFNTGLSFLKSPMTSVFYTVKLLDMMKDYLMLDIEKGNTKAFNTIGILKSVEFFTQLNPK